jgi:hypothetical protein
LRERAQQLDRFGVVPKPPVVPVLTALYAERVEDTLSGIHCSLSAFEERNHFWRCYCRRDVVRCGVTVRFEGRSVTDGDAEIRVFVDNDAEPRLSPDRRVHCESR